MGQEALYLLTGLATSVLAFALLVAGLTAGAILAVTVVGAPVIFFTILALRLFARLERRRAAMLLGAPIGEAYRPHAGLRLTGKLRVAAIRARGRRSISDRTWSRRKDEALP
jgi:hypothetical protein